MCTQKDSNHSEMLYNYLGQSIVEYIHKQMTNNLNQNKNNECELINMIYEYWSKYKIYVNILKGIFCYLDRFYVQLSLQPTVYEYALALFQKHVFEPYKSYLKSYLLDSLDLKRSGNDVNDSHVSAIIEMYNKLDSTTGLQYKDDLEPLILERCSNYYNKISPIWLNELTLMDYIFIIQYCIDDEMEYSKQYLNDTTNELLYNTILSSLLFNQQQNLFDKLPELKQMFETYQLNDLKMAYKYLSKLNTFNDKLTAIINEFMLSVIKNNDNCDLVKTYNKYLYLINHSFDNNNYILNSYNRIFKQYVNKNNFINELLNFFHNYLMTNHTHMNDTTTDVDNNDKWNELQDYVNVYNLLEHKNDFMTNYGMKLCYRLLNDRSVFENELSLLNKLLYDESNINNLYKMLEDVKKSKQLYNEYFLQTHNETSTSNSDYSFTLSTNDLFNNSRVLTVCNVYWPITPDERYQSVRLNQIFTNELELFKEYFMINNKFKNICYCYEYSYVELHYNLNTNDGTNRNKMELDYEMNNKPKNQYNNDQNIENIENNQNNSNIESSGTKVLCNMLQASLLLLFNYVDSIKVEDLLNELNLRYEVFEFLINSCQGLFVQVDGSLLINYDFLNNKNEVNLIDYVYQPLMIFNNSKSTSEQTTFNKDKLYDKYACIDSLIVKVMKKYKKLNQTHFLNILRNDFNTHNINVSYNEQVVLERIKVLIAKEYISQIDDDLIYIP